MIWSSKCARIAIVVPHVAASSAREAATAHLLHAIGVGPLGPAAILQVCGKLADQGLSCGIQAPWRSKPGRRWGIVHRGMHEAPRPPPRPRLPLSLRLLPRRRILLGCCGPRLQRIGLLTHRAARRRARRGAPSAGRYHDVEARISVLSWLFSGRAGLGERGCGGWLLATGRHPPWRRPAPSPPRLAAGPASPASFPVA